jgi:hypothetical protein
VNSNQLASKERYILIKKVLHFYRDYLLKTNQADVWDNDMLFFKNTAAGAGPASAGDCDDDVDALLE